MNSTIIRIAGGMVPEDHQYETPYGDTNRKELVDKYCHTIQSSLAATGGDHYSPHKAGELIMRAIISLLSATGPRQSAGYIINKLEGGLSSIGYYVAPTKYQGRPRTIIPALSVTGLYQKGFDGLCKDFCTGEVIGMTGVLRYLELLMHALGQTVDKQCDCAAYHLAMSVHKLCQEYPNRFKDDIELRLSNGLGELDLHLTAAPWYVQALCQE